MVTGNSTAVKIQQGVVEFAESYSLRTSTPDRRIDGYYIAFGTYWAEAVYQYHRRSAPESILLDSIVAGRCDKYYSLLWALVLDYDFLLLFQGGHTSALCELGWYRFGGTAIVRSYFVGLKKRRAERFHADSSS